MEKELEATTTTIGKLPKYLELSDRTGVAACVIAAHGLGKTQRIYEWAAAQKRRVCDRVISLMDPTADFAMAGFDPSGDLKFRYNRSFPFEGFEEDWLHPESKNPPVVFFDEFNQGQTAQQNLCMKIVLEHQLHNRKLIPGTAVFLAGNRLSDQAFVHRFSGPMANRVAWYYLEPSMADFEEYAHSTGRIDDFVLAYLKLNPSHLHISTMTEETADEQTKILVAHEGPHPTPRTWEFVSRSMRYLTDETRLTAISALVSTSVAINFEQVYRLRNDLPNISEVLKTGKGKTPKDVASRFVLVSALLKRIDSTNLQNALTYLTNLDSEVSVMFVRLMLKHKIALATHPAYTAWAVTHGHLLA